MSDLNDLFKAVSEDKKKVKEQQENSTSGKALKAVQERLKNNNEITELLEVFVEKKPQVKEIVKEVVVEKVVEKIVEQESFQQPKPPEVDPNIKAIQLKLKFLEQAISKIAATGPGSGEVNLRWLDDVARDTIADNRYLRYNDATKKFIFDDVDAVGEYITLWDTTNQTFGNSVPQLVLIGQTNGSRNISLTNGSRITFSKAGTYNIQYSLQAVNSDNAQWDVAVWLKVNGNNLADSNSVFTVPARKSVGTNGKLIMTSPIPVDAVAGDYVEIYVHTDAPTMLLQTIAADALNGIPRTPSVIIVVNKL